MLNRPGFIPRWQGCTPHRGWCAEQAARRVRSGATDAAMIDEALRALVARHRSAEVEASYSAYDEHPLDEPDEWGDLASFRRAPGPS